MPHWVLDGPLQHYTAPQEGIQRISEAFGMLPPLRSSGCSPFQGMHPTCHHCNGLHNSGSTLQLLQPAAARPIRDPQRHALARKQVLPPLLHGQQAA
jgi:hypothetical protein